LEARVCLGGPVTPRANVWLEEFSADNITTLLIYNIWSLNVSFAGGPTSDVLMEAEVEVQQDSRCSGLEVYPDFRAEQQICAGGDSADACQARSFLSKTRTI